MKCAKMLCFDKPEGLQGMLALEPLPPKSVPDVRMEIIPSAEDLAFKDELASIEACELPLPMKTLLLTTLKSNRALMKALKEKEERDAAIKAEEERLKKRGKGRAGKQFEDGAVGDAARFLANIVRTTIPLPTEDKLAYSYKVSGWKNKYGAWGVNLVGYGLTLDEIKEKDFGQRLLCLGWKFNMGKLEPTQQNVGFIPTIDKEKTETIKAAIYDTLHEMA